MGGGGGGARGGGGRGANGIRSIRMKDTQRGIKGMERERWRRKRRRTGSEAVSRSAGHDKRGSRGDTKKGESKRGRRVEEVGRGGVRRWGCSWRRVESRGRRVEEAGRGGVGRQRGVESGGGDGWSQEAERGGVRRRSRVASGGGGWSREEERGGVRRQGGVASGGGVESGGGGGRSRGDTVSSA